MTDEQTTEASGASTRLPVDDDVVARALLRWAQATYPGRKFTVVCEPEDTLPVTAAPGLGGQSS